MILCLLIGHKYYWKFGSLMEDSITYKPADFCTRCGKGKQL